MAVDLQKISGLPISFDPKSLKLEFQGDFPFIKKSERSLEEIKPYLKNPEAKYGPNPAYRVWRYAHLKKDDEKIKTAELRYDLTLIPPGTIYPVREKSLQATEVAPMGAAFSNGVNGEFAKTAGHYHIPHPEVYEVLYGRAYFLIQLPDGDYKNIKSAILVEAGPGEKFIIPPGFGHNTVNVFDGPLLMANWISEKAKYDYEPYKNLHGASYYFISGGELIDIEKNPNYESVSDIKKVRIREYPEFGILKNKPLYSLIDNLDKLRFLNYPEEFKGEWRNW